VFLFLPYQVDVPMARWPIANFLIIAATIWFYFAVQLGREFNDPLIASMVLDGWSLSGLFGYMFLHADFVHLVGNMIFLWVFGNAVCGKVGNIRYVLIYLLLGVVAGAAQNLLDPAPVVGASGAINGVVGMFLVYYPRNQISCLWIFIIRFGVVEAASKTIILIWLVFDIWGVLSGGGGVAYLAHLGGFGGGFALAAWLLRTGLVTMSDTEESLLDDWRGLESLGFGAAVRSPEKTPPPAPPAASESFEPYRPDYSMDTAAESSNPEPAMIRLTCPGCSGRLSIDRTHLGKRGRCPDCGTRMTITDPSTNLS